MVTIATTIAGTLAQQRRGATIHFIASAATAISSPSAASYFLIYCVSLFLLFLLWACSLFLLFLGCCLLLLCTAAAVVVVVTLFPSLFSLFLLFICYLQHFHFIHHTRTHPYTRRSVRASACAPASMLSVFIFVIFLPFFFVANTISFHFRLRFYLYFTLFCCFYYFRCCFVVVLSFCFFGSASAAFMRLIAKHYLYCCCLRLKIALVGICCCCCTNMYIRIYLYFCIYVYVHYHFSEAMASFLFLLLIVIFVVLHCIVMFVLVCVVAVVVVACNSTCRLNGIKSNICTLYCLRSLRTKRRACGASRYKRVEIYISTHIYIHTHTISCADNNSSAYAHIH